MIIIISAETSDGIASPLNVINPLEDKLNLFFEGRSYGEKIQKIYAGFICVSEVFESFAVVRPPRILRKEPALEIEYKLDFHTYRKMNDEERQEYALEEFIKAMEKFVETKKVKDFDGYEFIKDLKVFAHAVPRLFRRCW